MYKYDPFSQTYVAMAHGGSVPQAANQIAHQGRHGDDALLHVSKKELGGIAALAQAHGRPLTINPHTGLPEAFSLTSLLPTLIGAGLAIGTGGTSLALTPLQTGLLVGAGHFAATGGKSVKKSLMAGVGGAGGAGLAGGFSAAGAATTPAAPAALGEGAATGLKTTANMLPGAGTPAVTSSGSLGLSKGATLAQGLTDPSLANAANPAFGNVSAGSTALTDAAKLANPSLANVANPAAAPTIPPPPVEQASQIGLRPMAGAMPSNPNLAGSAPTTGGFAQAGRGFSNMFSTGPQGEAARDAFLGDPATKTTAQTGTGGGAGALKYSMMAAVPPLAEPPKYNPPKNNSMIRPYSFERTANEGAYEPTGSESKYFTDTYVAGEPYKAAKGGMIRPQVVRKGLSTYVRGGTGMPSYAEGGDVEDKRVSPLQIQRNTPSPAANETYMRNLNASLLPSANQQYTKSNYAPTGQPETPTYSYNAPKPIAAAQPKAQPATQPTAQPISQPTTSPSFTSNGVIPGTELPAYTFNPTGQPTTQPIPPTYQDKPVQYGPTGIPFIYDDAGDTQLVPTGQPTTQPTVQPTAPGYFPGFDEFKSTYTPPPPPTPQGEIRKIYGDEGGGSYYQDEAGQKFNSSGGEDASYTPINYESPEQAYQKLINERMANPPVQQPTYTPPTYTPPTQPTQPTSQPSDGGMVTDEWGNTFYQPKAPSKTSTNFNPFAGSTQPTADVMPRSTDSDAPGTPIDISPIFPAGHIDDNGAFVADGTPTGGIASLVPPDSAPMGGDLRGMVQPPIPQPQTPPPPPPPAPEVPTYGGSPIFTNEDGWQVYRDEEGRERRVPDEHPSNDRAGGLIKAKRYAVGGLASLSTYAAGGRLLSGEGDGMSDSIPAVIQGERPQRAALADGEFVWPADVVSHFGNGSTKAGAKFLSKVMDQVRHARVGNKQQGKQIKPNKFLSA